MRMMRATYIFALIFSASISWANDDPSTVEDLIKTSEKISVLLNSDRVDEAMRYISEHDDVSEAVVYRTIGTYYGGGRNIDRNDIKAMYFYGKGCVLGDFHSCRRQGKLLLQNGAYSEAEKIFLKIANEHNDYISMGSLVDLYRIKSWVGADEDKAKHWVSRIGK